MVKVKDCFFKGTLFSNMGSYLLQNIYITILNPVYKLTGKLDQSVRDTIVQGLFFCIPVYFILFYSRALVNVLPTHLSRHIVGSVLLLLIAVFSIEKPLKRVEWNRLVYIPLMLCGLCTIIIGFLHPIGDGYQCFGFMQIFVFPCLYFVWNNRRDYSSFFDKLAFAIVFVGFLYFIWCSIMAFQGHVSLVNGRATGSTFNSNKFSMIGMYISIAALYLQVRNKAGWKWFVFLSITFGIGLGIVLLGKSRLCVIICSLSILMTIWFYCKWCGPIVIKHITMSITVFFAIAIVMVSMTSVLLVPADFTQNEVDKNMDTKHILAAKIVIPKKDNIELFRSGVLVAEVEDETKETEVNPLSDRFFGERTNDANEYTSGRIRIWKGYVQFLNIMGNNYDEADWETLTGSDVRFAHNNFLEFAFRCGVPVGLLYFFMELVGILFLVLFVFFNKRRYRVLLLPSLFVIAYFCESLLEVATIPFQREAPLYFMLSLLPMIDGRIWGIRFKMNHNG